ncbi:MAG: class II aldolase/adducin family protein [Clostridia bacterium]|nr:class II aldolase/adducin family protein [Clostridia bacterium]
MKAFIENNKTDLMAFSEMSKKAGSRADYVQGGGGNTSVKLSGGLMAIKASGFCLADITPDNAYALINMDGLQNFYYNNKPENLADVEKEGAACAKENTVVLDGMNPLRPSVEAGFHSILKKFVCHTHSVYANLCCCSHEMNEIAEKAFADADYSWGSVPYTDPGANLTFAILAELNRVKEKTGKEPAVILMQNHGIIVHGDNADEVLDIHADANERLAKAFSLTGTSFPKVSVKTGSNGLIEADVPYMAEVLKTGKYPVKTLLESPLYPDQMVFLIGSLFENKAELEDGECSMDISNGSLVLKMNEKKALTITETITAVLFISENISKSGYTLSSMGEAAKNFIANWESEKYRKSLAGK